MELTFINATELQRAACETVAHNLLNLPFDKIPLIVTVEFVADPSPELHNEFGLAEWVYEDPESVIKIAEIAPDWNQPYNGVQFLQEVFAHELGHVFFAAFPTERREQIAAMFGAPSADDSVLDPEGAAWEDKIQEGIAETFKDAFLPKRFRRFPNRTNHLLSIHRYPAFRLFWRTGFEIEGESLPDLEKSWSAGDRDFNSYLCDSSVLSQFGAVQGHAEHFASTEYPGHYDYYGLAWEEGSFTLDHTEWLDGLTSVYTRFIYNHDQNHFTSAGPGSNYYLWYEDQFGEPPPLGTIRTIELKIKTRAVWLMEDGTLQISEEEYNFEEACRFELIEHSSTILPGWREWEIIDSHFLDNNVRHLYNDVENPELEWAIPSGAQAFAGLIEGRWWKVDLLEQSDESTLTFRWSAGYDFEIMRFKDIEGSSTPSIQMDDILVPTGNTRPTGTAVGHRPSTRKIAGRA